MHITANNCPIHQGGVNINLSMHCIALHFTDSYFAAVFHCLPVFHLCISFTVCSRALRIKDSHFELSTNNQFLELHCTVHRQALYKVDTGQNLESGKLEMAMIAFTKPFTPPSFPQALTVYPEKNGLPQSDTSFHVCIIFQNRAVLY